MNTSTKPQPQPQSPAGYRYFHAIAMIFVMCLIVSNTLAVKMISIGIFVLPAGIIVFPLAYLFGDVLTEIYGFRKTRSVIWWGFICLALTSVFFYIGSLLSPASFWTDQEPFARFFGFIPRIAASSFLAFLVGELLNSAVLSKLKVRMHGKHFWFRATSSTVVGQAADSVIFNVLAFAGVFAGADLVTIIVSGFVLKVAYEVVALPFTYAIVGFLKKKEGIDTYDRDISYNPISLRS